MRVGVDARWLGADGVGTYLRELLRELTLIPKLKLRVMGYPSAGAELDALGLPYDELRLSRYGMAQHWAIGRWAQEHRLDLVHAPFYVTPMFSPCPVVATIHDLELLSMPGDIRKGGLERGAILACHTLTVNRTAALITDSARSAAEIGERFPKARQKTHVVPLGVSDAWRLPEPRPRQDPNYILMLVGKQLGKKNVARAIRSFASYRSAGGTYDLWIVGDLVAEADRLLDLAGSARRNLRLLAPLARPELIATMQGASVFFFPSLHEGFGLPALEAMKAGVPVVASLVPALAEGRIDAALVVEPTDEAAMTDSLLAMERRPELRARLIAAGSAAVQDATWQQTAAATHDVYLKVLARP
jgi:alpha-1,3-rhamnosyl/mannosyltransferase